MRADRQTDMLIKTLGTAPEDKDARRSRIFNTHQRIIKTSSLQTNSERHIKLLDDGVQYEIQSIKS